MGTTEAECLDALREAARKLGESPSKAAYEELDITPSSTTITRTVGNWNEAKQRAGLETYEQGAGGGIDIEPKPEGINIPSDVDWSELSAQQRWYYKNREHRIETKEQRRVTLKRWFYELKRDESACRHCDETAPPALDFHHTESTGREVSAMVNDGYSKQRIREEIAHCTALCANCHRKEHYQGKAPPQIPGRKKIEAAIDEVSTHEARELRRTWLRAYKRDSSGCERCSVTHPACLDFHHLQNKQMRVSHMVSFDHSLSEIRDEIENCQLLCANCHRKEHFEPPER